MAEKEFSFNKAYYDKKLERTIEKDEVVKMTEGRAKAIVKNVLSQSSEFKDYKNFKYKMIEDSGEMNNGEN